MMFITRKKFKEATEVARAQAYEEMARRRVEEERIDNFYKMQEKVAYLEQKVETLENHIIVFHRAEDRRAE